uniref:CB1 cannabinoid receptor-interacting protein 1 n=1 Tax=Ditylenchus dipsaci TaxID=166011 RepID=A0A915ES09_9BILA
MATMKLTGVNMERKPSNALDVGHKKSMATGRKPSVSPQSVGSFAGTSFQLIINLETNEAIAFKQDGQRFGTSQKTLKLYSNLKYKCVFKCKPQVEFHNLHLGGSDLELISEHLHTNPGEYSAIWNTTGIDPTRKGLAKTAFLCSVVQESHCAKSCRQSFTLQGMDMLSGVTRWTQ